MFRRFIESQLERVKQSPRADLLGDKAYAKLEDMLRRKTEFIAGSTATHLIAQVVAQDNPIVATLPDLMTQAERDQALATIREQLDSGARSLPETLVESLELQLGNATDAFLEALERLVAQRDAIGDALLSGKRFQTIDDIELSAGDTHNCGRSVTVFHTDAGKLVYKPHDLRVDVQLHDFVERFFGAYVGIPRAIAFGGDFGVCEFVEKRRAQGAEEAERFWYAMGGLTAFAKVLGSTDLHYQNILCNGTKPYIIDLETLLSPIAAERMAYIQSSDTREYQTRSLGPSLLMPFRVEDMELSVLTNTDESGIAPVVDGKNVTVGPYLPAFKAGYHAAYTHAVEQREELRQALLSFPTDMAVRIVPRATRAYWMMLQKLNHHTAMASADGRQHSLDLLEEILHKSDASASDATIASELAQMRRGDIPYFYTHVGCLALYADGEELARDKFGTTAIGRILDTLDALGDEDEAFDLSYIDNAIGLYPMGDAPASAPLVRQEEDAETALSPQEAAETARQIFQKVHEMAIQTPNGRLAWGFVDNYSQSFKFGGAGLFYGFTGLAVFASACARLLPDGQIQERAAALVEEAVDEIRGTCLSVERLIGKPGTSVAVGEGVGFGGILTGIALMRRYAPNAELDSVRDRVLELVEAADYANSTSTDRIIGLAGLVSVLCRFEEYRDHTTALRRAADRILELKTFEYKDHVLWKTLPDVPRLLSGAGHGMAGIAEALIAASDLLGDDRYLPAAAEALDYELEAHRRYAYKFGTWADLRDFPPKRYMHGYCAGAPGTGIMLNRLHAAGLGDERTRALAELVRTSVDQLPLNSYDHLCCGNAALAEYRLSSGDAQGAARVLASIRAHALDADAARGPHGSNVTASLFNGISGMGYEMLRYAYPHETLSVL